MRFGIPEVFEDDVTGSLHYLYENMKHVLKVPIVNFMFRTLAHYDAFLHMAWKQVGPNMLTVTVENAAKELRFPNISFQAPKINFSLDDLHRSQLRDVIFLFNYVNSKLLLISIAWEESLGYRPVLGGKETLGIIQPGILEGLPNIRFVQFKQATPFTQQLLMDIMREKRSYDVASDYRALANYPEFLHFSWRHIKPFLQTNEYTLKKHELRRKARELVHNRFPYPVTFTPEHLHTLYNPKEVAGILGVIYMFSNFIAELIIDGECFRRIIE
ncbi:halocarboxylic acid dehydrogenase DehI family protein [Salirhabdus salicampi]|uniref:halocarboxylic acid dehydrogenase DehI family protein n=1 Tax=Salirhabdus salicampi TaxID=476102 RepID=UPI0020C202ED|nr:halocarboxylic acid dehydrogenase DehI family protein [Salirhabdus salicampi]MCP8615686.1 halocarboxylic acid dehydrogenase DehI family protein [Salirhabdus salicampi]